MIRGCVALALFAGCLAIAPASRVVYRDPVTDLFSVKHNELLLVKAGEVGEIHPAVLEYVLASEEGPLAAYYDLVLGLASLPDRAAEDLRRLTVAATALAGGKPPTGRHYARALARQLAPNINKALAKKGGSVMNETVGNARGRTFEGTAALWWGVPADLDANVLLRDYERDYGATTLRTVVYRYASTGLVVIRSSGTDRQYVWDVSTIPEAFDPNATLDYDRVAAGIVALHPFTTPLVRSR